MKLYVSLFLICSVLLAELPPQVYDKLKEQAPEILLIQVLHVNESVFSSSVDIEAKVIKIDKTCSDIKVSDTINISYERARRITGWVGPSQPLLLEKGTKYIAFLYCRDKKCSIAAKGKSFQTQKYYGRITESCSKEVLDFD